MADKRSLTWRLSDYVRKKPVSDNDLKTARLLLIDGLINMLAGRNDAAGKRMLSWGRALLDPENSSGLGSLDPARQAFLSAALCHSLELDDLHRASLTHPGCSVVPALLALGRGLPTRQVLTALLQGYEVCARIGLATGSGHHRTWHAVGTVGPFAAAMTAASLLELDDDQCEHALGIAGTQTGGLLQFLETGASSEQVHAGRAAEAGLIAATLASMGSTGAPQILEGPKGFFQAMCPDGHPEAVLASPDARWFVHDISIRRWPACAHTHPVIEAIRTIRKEMVKTGLNPTEFSRIDIETYQAAVDACDRLEVKNTHDAKFSLQHAAAAAMMFEDVNFESFAEAAREALGGRRHRVSATAALDLSVRFPQEWRARVTVHHGSSRKFTAATAGARPKQVASLMEHEIRAKGKRMLAGNQEVERAVFAAVADLAALDEPFDFSLF